MHRYISNLYRSYPAARAEPRVGTRAFSECLLIKRLCRGGGSRSLSDSEGTFRFLFCCTSDMKGAAVWVEW